MSSNSNKHRLYIALQDRRGAKGYPYHLSLLLESYNSSSAYRYHITNALSIDNRPRPPDNYVAWVFRADAVSPTSSRTLVARALIAKLPTTYSLDLWHEILRDALIEGVPIKQRVSVEEFNCATWIRDALEIVKETLGREIGECVPKMLPIGQGRLERSLLELGLEGSKKMLQRPEDFEPLLVDIRSKKDDRL
ncbi:hypothetical protein AX16_009958 [Volvariella volvacea WC 439]|nr:hypothetical protein AX16_009958 [Volvariella volvacea WC 439]